MGKRKLIYINRKHTLLLQKATNPYSDYGLVA